MVLISSGIEIGDRLAILVAIDRRRMRAQSGR